jgi:epsin
MDRLESLGNTLSQITLYDIKSMYNQVHLITSRPRLVIDSDRQAKNVVLNVSEMEAKVREATNDDPWYACQSVQELWF